MNRMRKIILSLLTVFMTFGILTANAEAFTPPDFSRQDCYDKNGVNNKFPANYCTWYVWGRTKEKLGITLSTTVSTWVYSSATGGFGSGPSTNSIAIYRGQNAELRHVAFIEYYDGTYVTFTEGNASNGVGEEGYFSGTMTPQQLRNRVASMHNVAYVEYVPLTTESFVEMVEPTISTNKNSYTVGEQINLSWVASSDNSNLSHYWLIINAPSGREVFGGTMYKQTSYSFTAEEIGTYNVTVYATPLGSKEGEGSLVATKQIEVKSNVVYPDKPTLTINVNSENEVLFSWNKTSNTHHYDLRIFNKNDDTAFKTVADLTGNSYKLVMPAGEYYANVTSVASDSSVYTCSENVSFSVMNTPIESDDGWYYVDYLPSDIISENYDIEYKNLYEKIQTSSPGAGWVNEGLYNSEFQNSGEPYWSRMELPTSDTRVLINYNYFHCCGANANGYVNYELGGNFQHEDMIHDVNSVTVYSSEPDWDNPNYICYQLKWLDGSWAWCKSGVTCDGMYGSHDGRSYRWYRNSQYQDRVKVDYYKYTKESDWSTVSDNAASTVKYRYKLKKSDTGNDVADIFIDVFEEDWFKDAVQYVYDHGMMSGDGNTFSPYDNMTRAMMVSTLYRLDGSPEVTDFTATSIFGDVYSGAWFETAVNWSYNEGISVGYPDIMQFGVSDSVTREQLAALLYRYAEKNGYDVSAREDLTEYIGYSEISEYAKDSMSWAVSVGVISGIRSEVDGVVTYDLAPKGYATRAQLASILMRFCDCYKIY